MPTVVRVLFGSAWSGAVGPARVLLVAAIIFSTAQALGAVLRAVGRPLNAAYAELVGLPVVAAGLAVLLPALGPIGAALASVLAYATTTAWMIRRTGTLIGLRNSEFLPRPGDIRHLVSLLDLRRLAPADAPKAAS
jgi:O-antigen/teichoic acid export membrane protein